MGQLRWAALPTSIEAALLRVTAAFEHECSFAITAPRTPTVISRSLPHCFGLTRTLMRVYSGRDGDGPAHRRLAHDIEEFCTPDDGARRKASEPGAAKKRIAITRASTPDRTHHGRPHSPTSNQNYHGGHQILEVPSMLTVCSYIQ